MCVFFPLIGFTPDHEGTHIANYFSVNTYSSRRNYSDDHEKLEENRGDRAKISNMFDTGEFDRAYKIAVAVIKQTGEFLRAI